MNWGVKIIVGLGAFMLFIVSAGVYMVNKDTDTLEEDDYYEKSLHYDEVYQRKQNVAEDQVRPLVKVERDTLYITFRQSNSCGELAFRRPADRKLDTVLPFVAKRQNYKIATGTFAKGNWQLEITWQHIEKAYTSDYHLYF